MFIWHPLSSDFMKSWNKGKRFYLLMEYQICIKWWLRKPWGFKNRTKLRHRMGRNKKRRRPIIERMLKLGVHIVWLADWLTDWLNDWLNEFRIEVLASMRYRTSSHRSSPLQFQYISFYIAKLDGIIDVSIFQLLRYTMLIII